jgi:hypothetical protein
MENLEQLIVELHNQYPNNIEFGEEVRKIAWSLEKQEVDPNQLTIFSNEEMDSMKR